MLTAGTDRRTLTIGNSVDGRDRQKNVDRWTITRVELTGWKAAG